MELPPCRAVLLLLLVLRGCSPSWQQTPRPNLLLLVADDMGWGDLGVNVPSLPSNTPNLDSLAKQGLRLTDFHSGASVCSPSRAALLTGRLGLRTGVVRNFSPSSVAGLPRSEVTLPESLRQAGYRTAMLGKWHLGTRSGFHPSDRGFERYLGVPYSLDMGCTSPPGLDFPPRSFCPRSTLNTTQAATMNSSEPLALPLYQDKEIIHQPVTLSTLAKRYLRFGEEFILHNSSAPFFLYVAFSHVHVPLAHGSRFKNATGRGIFANVLAEMDWVAGRLVQAAARRGDSTLTWFLSDNGPWDVKCSLAGLSGPFSGTWQRDPLLGGGGSAAKKTVWEAGHRVPSFLHWPDLIKPRTVSPALLSALDIFPTFLDLAGASPPSLRALDGISLARALLKGKNISGHTELFHPNSGASGPDGVVGAVRVGNFKTIYFAGGADACSQQAGPARTLTPPLAFNLRHDPSESQPLKHPQAAAVLERSAIALERLLASVRADHTSTADYSTESAARPCCDSALPACSCPWDC